DDAEALYRQALVLAPREPSLHERLGDLYTKQKKWDLSIEEFRKTQEYGDGSDETDRRIAEALVNLGRAEEARAILDRLKKSGSGDVALESKLSELEDIGRWGNDLQVFRSIQSSTSLTRAEVAVLLLRYFPQIADLRKTAQIITDIGDSSS